MQFSEPGRSRDMQKRVACFQSLCFFFSTPRRNVSANQPLPSITIKTQKPGLYRAIEAIYTL